MLFTFNKFAVRVKYIVRAAAFVVLSLYCGRAMCAEKAPAAQVVALPVSEDPSVSFHIWFHVGSQNDPQGKEGLAALTAEMISKGATKKLSYEEILDKMLPLAAGYGATTNEEMTVISGRVHKDNLAEYYPLLLQAIEEPAFKEEDLKRLKETALNYLSNTLRYSSDEDLGKAVLYNSIFHGTPYGHLPTGTIAGVKSVTLDDVREFYKKYYTRDNVTIGIAGGYSPKTLDQLRADLAKLPSGKPAVISAPSPQPIKGVHVTIVEKPCIATAMSLGYPIDVLRNQPDWYALALADSWFGQHRNSSSHLYQVLREERGLNYGDYSYIERFPNGGALTVPPANASLRKQIFEMWIRPVPHAANVFALRAAVRELHKFIDVGLTKDDFNTTRNFLKTYVLNFAPTTSEQLAYALDDQFYGVQGSHLANFRTAIKSLSLAETNAAVKKYLQYDNLQIVIVTKDAEALKKALVSGEPSSFEYPTPKSKEVLEEDKEIVKYPLGIKAENVKIVPVETLFEK